MTRRRPLHLIVVAGVLAAVASGGLGLGSLSGQGAVPRATPTSGPAVLPADIKWETNNEDPPIGSAEAIRGGTFNYYMGSYPLTFRLMGPNSNDAFAGWNRLFTQYFQLVILHPVTDRFIPWMATHWYVAPDHRTLYFRLDRDARWSDGKPITARDYVFTWEMMRSPHIVDPFYNNFAEVYLESVDRIDDYTLRIVGKRPSWRPLYEYALYPTPAHANVLDETWVARSNNQFQLAIGPYVVSEAVRGQSVTLTRQQNWWGDGKRYFRGMYNFDKIHLRVLPPERQIDYFRRGELDFITEGSARAWNEEYTFPAVQHNWVRRARVFTDWPSGLYGLHMNLEAPIFRSKEFRKAMQHLFNFERLNRNLMFNEYFRQVSFFEGTQYANPDLKPYAFDPQKAAEYLEQAGYYRPSDARARGLLAAAGDVLYGLFFTRSATDDVRVNGKGEKASFSLIYGGKGLERHLTVMQQEYRRAGVDIQLRSLEPGTAFERGLERKYEMTLTGRTSNLYPSPRQYFHSEFKRSTNNNNIWGFANPEVDSLIDIYEENFDAETRKRAMFRMDEIIQDEAFYIPFWAAPYMRIVHWDYLRFPEFYFPKRTEQFMDYLVMWIDPARRSGLERAMTAGTPLPADDNMDKDFYRIRERFQ